MIADKLAGPTAARPRRAPAPRSTSSVDLADLVELNHCLAIHLPSPHPADDLRLETRSPVATDPFDGPVTLSRIYLSGIARFLFPVQLLAMSLQSSCRPLEVLLQSAPNRRGTHPGLPDC